MSSICMPPKIAEALQAMLDLHKALSSPRPEHERTLIARRIG